MTGTNMGLCGGGEERSEVVGNGSCARHRDAIVKMHDSIHEDGIAAASVANQSSATIFT